MKIFAKGWYKKEKPLPSQQLNQGELVIRVHLPLLCSGFMHHSPEDIENKSHKKEKPLPSQQLNQGS
ncbi:hypothetical protein [Iningainema tapete]|uniref:Uncharacterized protein n=1 Tax=Iningainema tapete BLCC-T55 TaxID=2748662 RepID=A0A8J6XBH6_9CYAN|nr:hypothetical protein [Iningainema tapete]MBD2771638.1 hypothetical protein [Iningainema tapete BLCC-T55]MBD2771639.1 hypothetical protein [Iningainema tapete BLCC-T55]